MLRHLRLKVLLVGTEAGARQTENENSAFLKPPHLIAVRFSFFLQFYVNIRRASGRTMFKVEPSSSGSSANNPNLSPSQQNNFDFELSFCDDGTTEDLFDSFNTSGNRSNGSSPTADGHGRSGTADSSGTSEPSDTVHIKIEPDDRSSPMLTCSSGLDGVRIKLEPNDDALMSLDNEDSPGTTPPPDSALSPLPTPGHASNNISRKGKHKHFIPIPVRLSPDY